MSNNATVLSLFEESVQKHSNKIAIKTDNTQITYAELNARAMALAQLLFNEGVCPEEPIGVFLDRGISYFVSLIAILKLRCAYVPIDPAQPTTRVNGMLSDAQVRLVLTKTKYFEKITVAKPLDVSHCEGTGHHALSPLNHLAKATQPQDLAYIIFTSGSTGRPKGVEVEHHSLTNFVLAYIDFMELTVDDNVTAVCGVGFDAACLDIWPNLIAGASIFIPSNEVRLDTEKLIEYSLEHKISLMNLSTPLAERLLLHPRHSELALRILGTGGDKLKLFPSEATPFRLYNLYGPTEATVAATFAWVKPTDKSKSSFPSVGKAIRNYHTYILNAAHALVPYGETGELCIGGVGVARGYCGAPELTEKKFITLTLQENIGPERIYKTGDLARFLPNGEIEVLGRNDDQIKIRGQRIEIGEIEYALTQIPNVTENIVLVLDDPLGEKCLVAYVVLKEMATSEIKQHLIELLPPAMVPSYFVNMTQFPLNLNGKVDKKALPPPLFLYAPEKIQLPITELEKAVHTLFCRVLKQSEVDVTESFFHLGGHSLLVAHLLAEVNATFKTNLRIPNIFAAPSVRTLATLIEESGSQSGQTPTTLKKQPNGLTPFLSHEQEQMFYLYQTNKTSNFYNLAFEYRIVGEFSPALFQTALQQLIERHKILKTIYRQEKGLVVPVEFTQEMGAVIHSDATSAKDLIQADRELPFKLSSEPPLRCHVFPYAKQEHLVYFNIHHIAFDGWSVGLLEEELTQLYNGLLTNAPSPAAPLFQYSDYAFTQQSATYQEAVRKDILYWREELTDAPSLLEFPTDKKRGFKTDNAGQTETLHIPRAELNELKAFAQKQDVTLFVLLLSAYQLLLSKYAQQEEVVVGFPVAQRQLTGNENLIGYFVNSLFVRTPVRAHDTIESIASHVKEKVILASTHNFAPFSKIVEECEVERTQGYDPIFQTIFSLQNASDDRLQFAGTRSTCQHHTNLKSAKFDFSLTAQESADGLTLLCEYKTALFYSETIQQLLKNYQHVLHVCMHNPKLAAQQIGVVNETEKHKLLHTWNHHANLTFAHDNVVSLFMESVRQHPNKLALVEENRSLSYADLNQHANRIANFLVARAVEPNELVAVYLDRSISLVVCELASLKSGAAYLPIDPALPLERVKLMLTESNVRFVLTNEALGGKLTNISACIIDCENTEQFDDVTSDPNVTIHPKSLAYVIFTSGTTGKPKGVEIEHVSLANFVQSYVHLSQLSHTDHTLQTFGVSFDGSCWDIWPSLTAGATLFIPSSEIRISTKLTIDYLIHKQITVANLPTPLAEALLIDESHVYLPLRILGTGGDKLKVYPSPEAKFKLYNCYGPTEATIAVTMSEVLQDAVDPQRLPHIGKALPNCKIYILDKYNQPVPTGVKGELCIAGICLARGYRNNPILTAEKFITLEIAPELIERIYKTGDVARYTGTGNIEILGRNDDQVKIRGQRIELGEVEFAISQIPDVKAHVVLVKNDTNGEKHIVAYIVAKNSELDGVKLRRELTTHLTAAMIPSYFIFMDEFPLTHNGKIDKKNLPEPIFSAAMETAETLTSQEKIIYDIFKEVLNIDGFSKLDSFFDLGGHSLLLAKLSTLIQDRLKIDVPFMMLIKNSSVESLSAIIQKEFSSEIDHLIKAKIDFLNQESQLPIKTLPASFASRAFLEQEEALFLTGTTGFFGPFLLEQLLNKTNAQVYCHIRAANLEEGRNRIEKSLIKGQIHLKGNDFARIIPVCGDLGLPHLGMGDTFHELAQKVGSIYHNGAQVHSIFDYEKLKAPNVLSTRDLIEFSAQGRPKAMHYVSTISVLGSHPNPSEETVTIEDKYIEFGGYPETKLVSERLVLQAQEHGFKSIIYRLGRLTNHSKTGVYNQNDTAFRFIAGCLQLKLAPSSGFSLDLGAVDFIAEALVTLSLDKNNFGECFHLQNPNSVAWPDLVRAMQEYGFEIQTVGLEEWFAELKKHPENPFYPYLSLLNNKESLEHFARENNLIVTPTSKTIATLRKYNLNPPQASQELVGLFFKQIKQNWV